MDFFNFHPSKIRVSLTHIVSSLFPLQCRISSDRHHHTATLGHDFFPLSQDELAVSVLSSGNTLSRRLPSRVETEALNSHHCHRLSSSDRPTPTLHSYRKIISTLTTLPTTHLCLHFTTSLARAPRN
jgi:hypothetical protein